MKQKFTDNPLPAVVRQYETRLSKDHVAVLLAASETGAKYRDLAAKLGKPIGTVKSSLHRARAAISALIEADGRTAQ